MGTARWPTRCPRVVCPIPPRTVSQGPWTCVKTSQPKMGMAGLFWNPSRPLKQDNPFHDHQCNDSPKVSPNTLTRNNQWKGQVSVLMLGWYYWKKRRKKLTTLSSNLERRLIKYQAHFRTVFSSAPVNDDRIWWEAEVLRRSRAQRRCLGKTPLFEGWILFHTMEQVFGLVPKAERKFLQLGLRWIISAPLKLKVAGFKHVLITLLC